MLKKIIKAWKSEGLLVEIFSKFQAMLEETEEMFETVYAIVFEKKEVDLNKKLFKTDIHVNKAERKVRKKVIEHLAIRPSTDMPSCLILMSIVKDTERIGDYCKNLYQAYQLSGESEILPEYQEPLRRMHEQIASLFKETMNAIHEHSEELGKEVIIKQSELSDECDSLIKTIAASGNLDNSKAVGYALMCRHYKRIASHLANVASSVVVPVHKIDFYYERGDDQKKHYIK